MITEELTAWRFPATGRGGRVGAVVLHLVSGVLVSLSSRPSLSSGLRRSALGAGLALLAAGLLTAAPAAAEHAEQAEQAEQAGPAVAAERAVAAEYSAPLRTAVRDLPVAGEVRTGYDRDLFPHWVDADGDGCDARRETLIEEADDPPSVGSGCSLTGGRWFSYYDAADVTDDSDVSVDHMVPLAEAWDSGARSWSSADRRAFANDLGDRRTLVGVTVSSNSSKSDSDPAEWLPDREVCRYVAEFTAVKLRWRLTVDTAERTALVSRADACTNSTITVTRAR